MNDEQDHDENRMMGFSLSIAVVVAIAVSLWMAFWATSDIKTAPSGAQSSAATAMPVAAPAAVAAAVIGKAITEVDTAPAVATGGDYPETVSLFFDSGKINQPLDAAQTVSKIVAWSKTSPNTKIGISGYHDKAGDATKNAELAKNRALGTREILISAGVAEDRLILVKPQSTSGGGPEDKQARRVDIYPAQ
jgi:outer membrane protein OmpA-like peptidoglycan-associated protein